MKEIEGIEVRKLAPEYIEGFKQLIESLKNEKVKMGLENVDVDKWIASSLKFQALYNFGFFLAIDLSKNKVVGFSNILRNITKEKKYNIQNFFEIGIGVEKEYRRKGIGTMLLKHVLENAKNLKIEKVFVDIHKDNLASIAFSKRMGLRRCMKKIVNLFIIKIFCNKNLSLNGKRK
jgi:predicted acetyltransferase